MAADPVLRGLVLATRKTDSEIYRLLAEAARSTEKTIRRLMADGSTIRAAQQRIALFAIKSEMEALWNGVDAATRRGIERAQKAAIASAGELDAVVERALGRRASDALRGVWTAQARRGVVALIAYQREGTQRQLSARVYRNRALSEKWVEREVSNGITQGLSAREMSANVRKLIRPDTPGGVSYAALRLSRTEIANAHHAAQIASQRDVPWVAGFKWRLSSSHPHDDVCDSLAAHNEGLGEGVFSRATVPVTKPHPHCLCILLPELQNEQAFIRDVRSGRYDQTLQSPGAA